MPNLILLVVIQLDCHAVRSTVGRVVRCFDHARSHDGPFTLLVIMCSRLLYQVPCYDHMIAIRILLLLLIKVQLFTRRQQTLRVDESKERLGDSVR